MKTLDGLNFKDFLCFVTFGVVKRCAIRPAALAKMRIGEFKQPIFRKENVVLVHVKEQKVSAYNDGYVNFPTHIYESCQHYLVKWRPKPFTENDYFFFLPGLQRPVTSQDLLNICRSKFERVIGKSFNFTNFRQYLQTVFCQTCTDENQKKWFNRIMQHRLNIYLV